MQLQVLQWFNIISNTYLLYSQTSLYGHQVNMHTFNDPLSVCIKIF